MSECHFSIKRGGFKNETKSESIPPSSSSNHFIIADFKKYILYINITLHQKWLKWQEASSMKIFMSPHRVYLKMIFKIKNNILTNSSQIHTWCPCRVATDLSSPVTNDEGGSTQADNKVDVDDVLQMGLLLQRTRVLFRRRRVVISILPPLHPAQPVEGRLPPGLSWDWGWWVWKRKGKFNNINFR